jgi:8-oxo-dGTP pyrophosphatase MutT (NUDIX family)
MTAYSSIPIESPGINLAIVRQDSDAWRFLLLKRAGTQSYPGFWGFLTGRREGSETVPQLAVRELREETNLAPLKLWASEYCVQFYEPAVDRVWILPVIVAVVESGETVKLCEENSDFRWVTAAEARELLEWQNVIDAVQNLDRELRRYPAASWVELPVER